MDNYEEAINIIRAMISPENSCHCKDIVQELKMSGLLTPDIFQLEFGVEYTGVNHGSRHVEWYYEDTSGESRESALRNISRKSLRLNNPKIVYRLVSHKEYLEV